MILEKLLISIFLLYFILFPSSLTYSQEKLIVTELGQVPPGNDPKIFSPGFISKQDRFEFSGSFSPDGNEFYYTVSDTNFSNTKILFTKMINGEWINPSVLSISGFDVDWSVFLSSNGNRLFFSSGRPIQSWNLDIWMSERVDSAWSEPIKLKINSSRSDFAGTTTSDGTLYFSSRYERQGSIGIYKSKLVNNEYSFIEKLPYPINTNNELDGSPFISSDESFLLFSSQRDGSCGCDIYISFHNKDDTWTEVRKLGDKINTDRNESLPFLSPDDKYLFFTRDNGRDAINREIDIYWVSSSVIDSIKQILVLDKKD